MPAPTYMEGEQLVQLLRGCVPEDALIVPDFLCPDVMLFRCTCS